MDKVRPVTEDARGILRVPDLLAQLDFRRAAPPAELADVLDRFWLVSWDRRGDAPFEQDVLPHPVVNVVFQQDGDGAGATVTGTVVGVQRVRVTRCLAGRGRAVAAMFRPAGFRGLLGRPMHTITDVTLPADAVLGPEAERFRLALPGLDADEAVTALAALLARRSAEHPLPPGAAAVRDLAERAAADPSMIRIEDLARAASVSVRQVQRAFADHLGVSPAWVIRRYRLLEAAEQARRDGRPDWARVARELGYSDQAHLVREFSRLVGQPPARYARGQATDTLAGP